MGGCVAATTVLRAYPATAFVPPSFPPFSPAALSSSGVCCSKSSLQTHPSTGRGWASSKGRAIRMSSTDIESPFATPGMADMDDDEDKDAFLTLTLENVETVLDEMRPYLMSDG